jgi:hypothetical protein
MSVLTVGPGQQYTTIAAAVAASHAGDTIDVHAGTYVNDFINVYQNITLQAVGGVVKLVATVSPPNRKAIVDEGGKGVNVTINGFDISGAAVGDGNGAAIRYEGGNLTLNNDYLHNNQDGLLGAADLAGSITINDSEVAYNSGNGSTHNLYIGDIANFTLRNSYVHDANVGHEVKSRAENTTIIGSRIFDNNSTASYSIDLSNGGNATIENNVIEQGPNSQNNNIIAYGAEGSLHAGHNVLIANNTIVNDEGNGTGVLNKTSFAVTFQNNSVYGLTNTHLVSGPATGANTTAYLSSRPVLNKTSDWMPSTTPGLSGSVVLSAATELVALPTSTRVAVFTDPNLSDLASGFTALINWGDGTAATTGTVTGSAGSFAVIGGHTYAAGGTDPVSVTITRTSDGSQIALTGNVLVGADDVLSGTGRSFAATAGQSFSGVVASFSDTDPVTPASSLAARISWGDGTTTIGTVSGSAGSFTVSGTHTYTTAGTDTVTVTLSYNAATAPATATSTANISAQAGNTITIPASQSSVTENVSNATITATSGNHLIFIGGTGDVVTATGGVETIQALRGGNKITTGTGNDVIQVSGSNNVINAGTGNNAVIDSGGSNNTIVLPGVGGSDTIYGYVLTNGDKLDLRTMLGTTGWNGSVATIGNYIKLTTSGGHAQIRFDPSGVAGGATYTVATLYASASVSLNTLLAHSIT